MNKQVIIYFSKISALTTLFFAGILISHNLLKAEKLDNSFSNLDNYKIVSNNKIPGYVGVAISSSVGTRLKQKKDYPVLIYKDVMDISYILSNKQIARDKIITNNMILLNEYLSILKTNLKSLLSQTNDREATLEAYISQLKFRYKNTLKNITNLKLQKATLLNTYNLTNSKLNSLKIKIGKDFKNFDSNKTIKNIDDFLKLKEENTYAKTYIIFIDKFITYFQILNNYNKTLLDTLINNKELIIKNAHLVLPSSGTKILQKLDLIYTERDWKNVH